MFKSNLLFFKKNKFPLMFFLLFSFFTWLAGMLSPILTGNLIDAITISKDFNSCKHLIFLICILSIVSLFTKYFMSILLSSLNSKLMYNLCNKTLVHLKNANIINLYNLNPGYLSQRIYSDSNSVASFCITSIRDLPINIITLIFSLIVLLKINVDISLVLLLLIPFYIFIYKIFKDKMYKCNLVYKESENNFFEELNCHLESIKFIKINSLLSYFDSILESRFKFMYNDLMKLSKISSLFWNSGTLFTIIANIFILTIGAIKIINGEMTIGSFTIINTYLNSIIGTTDYFLNLTKNYQMATVSHNRIQELFNLELESFGNIQLDTIENIKFKDVSFSYSKNNCILTKFNYEFKKGNIYRIIGENGKGKSTLLNILVGLYSGKYLGSVLYNDINISNIDMLNVRKKNISFVEQDLSIINGTILDNIKLDNIIQESDLFKLIDLLNLNGFLNSKDQGINTKISRKSYSLSGGEKQKINLLRSLLKDTDVMIFDEANSALDIESNKVLKNILSEIKKDKIVILISHSDIFKDIVDYNVSFELSKSGNI